MKETKRIHAVLMALAWTCLTVLAADEPFNGLGTNLGNLYRTSPAQTRSISVEKQTCGGIPALKAYAWEDRA